MLAREFFSLTGGIMGAKEDLRTCGKGVDGDYAASRYVLLI